MKRFFVIAGVMLLGITDLLQAAEGKDWHSLDDANRCTRQGSPADMMRKLAAKGVPYTVNDKFRAGIVLLSWLDPNRERNVFYYPTIALCKEMETIFTPKIDPKYE
ncbi:hypothetical protein D3C81_1454560 [compost metagenome]